MILLPLWSPLTVTSRLGDSLRVPIIGHVLPILGHR